MLRPKTNIKRLVPTIHGGIDHLELEKLGISVEDILDFSVSTNPFGPPLGTSQALSQVAIDRYPDSESTELTLLLSDKLNITPQNLLIGSGSTELIRLVATAYFSPDDVVLIPQPTYGEYEIACNLVGASVLKQVITEESGFRLNLSETMELIRKHQPRGIFLCNPNNPTGQYLSRQDVAEILSSAGDSLVILDEAYIAFTEDVWPSLELTDRDNVVLLRSMTKDYALAGLRLGYLVSAKSTVSVIKRVRPPWNVSSLAQEAGIHALKTPDYLEECRVKIRDAKQFLIAGLKGLELSPLPSQTNFFLVEVGDAARLRQALLRRGILVRDCTSFGLSGYIRLAPRPITQCQILLDALKDPEVYCYAR